MQEPDPRPGYYYVGVQDGPKHGKLAGPFTSHTEALAMVEAAKREAEQRDHFACFYAYGTFRAATNIGPGLLNSLLGLPEV